MIIINTLYIKLSSLLSISRAVIIPVLFSLLCLPACTDDPVSSHNPNPSSPDGFSIIDLPGYIGISIHKAEVGNTRASDKTSDDFPFDDGFDDEYALLQADDGDAESYHYLLLYSSTDSNSKPWIFKIDVSDPKFEDPANDNITLSISKMFPDEDNPEELAYLSEQFSSVASFANLISGMKPYVLLNFKLDVSNPNFYSPYSVSGSNTLDVLKNLTRSQLETLQMTDYKISKEGKDYFIMSNSVYSNNTNSKIIDGQIFPTKIYSTRDQALADPAIITHVERLAAKVTLSFNIDRMSVANFDPYGDMMLMKVYTDTDTGLPDLDLTVQRVNMQFPGGIKFDNTGYEIQTVDMKATIKILGYGLSNTEARTNLFKDINYIYGNVSWKWNDPSNYRSYWAQDQHYELTNPSSPNFTKVEGYPHQFRLAIDTDSVSSLHKGTNDPAGYLDYDNPKETYKVGNVTYESYNKLGKINTEAVYNNVALSYKTFNQIYDDYQRHWKAESQNDNTTFTYYPLYTLENTYSDQGMLTGGQTWKWPWQRVPYGTATNLIVLAQIVFSDNNESGSSAAETGSVEGDKNLMTRAPESSVRTVYLGQNNIFYLKKVNLLNSKLAILNSVMLSGGNAGIQILHGQWDHHIRWEEGDVDQDKDTHLDKVAWSEGSKLWFAELKTNSDGTPLYDSLPDPADPSKSIYKPVFSETNPPFQVTIDINKNDDEIQALDLIPAEISGGDGQALIAPSQKYMGMKWKYYLAPPKDESGTEMDMERAVEINYNHLVALIHKIIGPVDVYKNGRMYFSVPIPHRYSSIAPTNWSHLGAFGVVRNNWYDISVTEFTHLGTPVDDPDQPIVPVMDIKRSYINMGVELLNWHEIVEDNIPMM
ncbi:MAG: Mfa1 fimbrilin C-terminal domain-containing protein [Muribaculaceae bacterium]|nr:Mfa1 fimbrilin C-terminal domain-containing protein [Muribaculaceae bacterium]